MKQIFIYKETYEKLSAFYADHKEYINNEGYPTFVSWVDSMVLETLYQWKKLLKSSRSATE